jgi:hypothetical protein
MVLLIADRVCNALPPHLPGAPMWVDSGREEFLSQKFPEEHEVYRQHVSRLFPRFKKCPDRRRQNPPRPTWSLLGVAVKPGSGSCLEDIPNCHYLETAQRSVDFSR